MIASSISRQTLRLVLDWWSQLLLLLYIAQTVNGRYSTSECQYRTMTFEYYNASIARKAKFYTLAPFLSFRLPKKYQ